MVAPILTRKEQEQFHELFPAVVEMVKQAPEISQQELVAQICAVSGISSKTSEEWLDRTISSLYDDGVLVEKSFEALKNHFVAMDQARISVLADKVLVYVMSHPLTFMVDRAVDALLAEKARWESEPDMIENVDKQINLEMINAALDKWQKR